jgi:hypothetical protein
MHPDIFSRGRSAREVAGSISQRHAPQLTKSFSLGLGTPCTPQRRAPGRNLRHSTSSPGVGVHAPLVGCNCEDYR